MENTAASSPMRLRPFTTSKKNIATYLRMQKLIASPHVETTHTEAEARRELAGKHMHIVRWEHHIAGFIAHEMREEPEAHGYIWELLVKPDFRGRHIGRQTVNQVLERFYKTVPVHLKVHPRNTPAIRTYFDCGFMIERWLEPEGDAGPRLLMIRNR